MKNVMGIGCRRIGWVIGMAAMLLASSPAWAKENACQADTDCKAGYRCGGDGKCRNAKDLCRADTDCKSGYRCAADSKCHNAKDVCRADAECKSGYRCGIDSKCHKANDNFCASDADCDTGERCAADSKCHKVPNFCTTGSDCKTGESCGTDSTCHKDDHACRVDTDCGEGERCWDDGACRKADKPCIADSDCKDGQYCSDDGKCHKDNECDDQNGCTIDRFAQGHCIHYTIADCQPCSTGADCDDVNACTTDVCDALGVCEHVQRDGCARCTAPADCDDGNPCTSEACAADGSCQLTTDPNCGRVASPAEVCNDGIDNDANGLADFEDAACCSQGDIFSMNLSDARIQQRGATSKLRLRSILPAGVLSGVNALRQDLVLQIRPGNGTDVLYARIPAGKFMRWDGALKFRDPKHLVASAAGLDKVVLKPRRDASVRLRVEGRQVAMAHMEQGPLQITIGFATDIQSGAENRCSATLASFRAKGGANLLIAP